MLVQAIAAQAPNLSLKVKVTVCHGAGTDSGHDILVFSDQVRYVAVQSGDVPVLVKDHLVGNRISLRLRHEPLPGQHVLVCVHGRRDERCGLCKPLLVACFISELERRGLGNQITVWQTSHVGGYRYASNVLIYPGGAWCGYVTPADVPRPIDKRLLAQKPLVEHWRGQMGLSTAEQLALFDRGQRQQKPKANGRGG